MLLIYTMGFVVCGAAIVVGFLFFLLSKESGQSEVKIVPIINPEEVLKSRGPSPEELEYKRKVEELEEELRGISDKSVAQAQEAMAMIETLTKENQELKNKQVNQVDENKEQFVFIQQHAEQLRQENVNLQSQLDSSHVKLEQLQEEATAIRKQMGEELTKASAAVEQIRIEKEALVSSQQSSIDSSQALTKELADAKAAIEQLRQDVQDVQMTAQKLKELNASLIEKNQSLQYELTKHRAQASGLEKICENYKSQLSARMA